MNDSSRERILQAAGQVFADNGYHGATVRDICQAADVNVAAVNYYFGDKRQLYVETVRQAREMRKQQYPFPERPADAPAATRLRDFVFVMARRMLAGDTEPWHTRLMIREILEPTEACREMVEDYFRPQFERLLSIVAELVPSETPRYRIRQIGFSIIGQCFYYRVAGNVVAMLTPEEERAERYSPDQIADHVSNMVLSALQNHSSLANADGEMIDRQALSGAAEESAVSSKTSTD